MLFNATLEKADRQLLRILDAEGNGQVIGHTEIETENLTDAAFKASEWAETNHLDLENNAYARYPVKFLSVSAFGNKYGLGYASRRYRRGGPHSRQDGFLLFVKSPKDTEVST